MTKGKRPFHHVNALLRLRLRAYGFICALLCGFVTADLIRFDLHWSFLLLAVLVGVVIGFVFSFTHHISWDSQRGEVVARLDVYGMVLLALYFALELNRDQIAAHFARGVLVSVLTYATLAGVMFGRGLGMSHRIVRILRRKKIMAA